MERVDRRGGRCSPEVDLLITCQKIAFHAASPKTIGHSLEHVKIGDEDRRSQSLQEVQIWIKEASVKPVLALKIVSRFVLAVLANVLQLIQNVWSRSNKVSFVWPFQRRRWFCRQSFHYTQWLYHWQRIFAPLWKIKQSSWSSGLEMCEKRRRQSIAS